MARTITLAAVLSPSKEDQFAHAFDVFEPFKRLVVTDQRGQPFLSRFTVSLNHDNPDYAKIINVTRAGLESEGDVKCLAVFVPGQPIGAWRDETCTVISTGRGFGLFDLFLKDSGFVPPESAQCPSSIHASSP